MAVFTRAATIAMPKQSLHLAVVTGGNGSLGSAIAAGLDCPGWRVDSPGSQQLDVRDPAAIQSYFETRQVDLLVCAAGITRDAPLSRLQPEAWDETWEVNFKGALNCAEAVIPGMLERGRGHIVFISSFSALHPPVGQAAYAAAKAALLGLLADLSVRHGARNLRVNAILPGFIETRMTQAVTAKRSGEILAAHSLGRFNGPAEVAGFVSFLHHHMPHTSGQSFQLDSRPSSR